MSSESFYEWDGQETYENNGIKVVIRWYNHFDYIAGEYYIHRADLVQPGGLPYKFDEMTLDEVKDDIDFKINKASRIREEPEWITKETIAHKGVTFDAYWINGADACYVLSGEKAERFVWHTALYDEILEWLEEIA